MNLMDKGSCIEQIKGQLSAQRERKRIRQENIGWDTLIVTSCSDSFFFGTTVGEIYKEINPQKCQPNLKSGSVTEER